MGAPIALTGRPAEPTDGVDVPPADGHGALLAYARESVPAYAGVADSEPLPLVDRSDYEPDGSRFRSRDADASSYLLTSSGTTGRPLTIALDPAAWYAVNHHFFEKIRAVAGLSSESFRAGRPGVLFVTNKPQRPTHVTPLPSLGGSLYVRVQLGALGANLRAAFDRLQAPILYGKPTYLLDLRAALIAQGLARPAWSPKLLLVSGEPLHPDDWLRLTSYFGAPVIDALASTEGGLMAATEPDGAEFRVFDRNVRLEVRTRDGCVRDSGEGELVLTNLVYRGTVFVRYRTGDWGELRTDPDGTQTVVRLWGREPSAVPFVSGPLAKEALVDAIGFIPGLGDFQVILGEERSLLRWEPDVRCPDDRAVHDVLHATLRTLLPDEEVGVERASRITPRGGKKRRVVVGGAA